jgi:hypothetical protein
MKKNLIILILIALIIVQGVSGFSVSSVRVNPSGDLRDGTPVTVTFEIPRTGILLYDQLVITTDLDTPVWDPVVRVRDQETPLNPAFAHGNTLTINGAEYHYPSGVQVTVRVIMNGTVPYNHTPSQKLLDIRQLDAEGSGYAYPSGYTLPMPGSPAPTLSETDTEPATPAKNPVSEHTIPATLTRVPAGTSPITTLPVAGETRSIPTAGTGSTPAAAGPSEPLVIFGTAGIAFLLMKK